MYRPLKASPGNGGVPEVLTFSMEFSPLLRGDIHALLPTALHRPAALCTGMRGATRPHLRRFPYTSAILSAFCPRVKHKNSGRGGFSASPEIFALDRGAKSG